MLGCSGTYPGPDSPCSSYLLEHDGFRLLLDAGNGSTGVLQRCCEIVDVDAALVSHLHGDHYLDLVTLTYARRYHPSGPPPPLPVFGPTGTREQLLAAFARPESAELLDAAYAFTDLRPGRLDVGPFAVATERVDHPVETYGMRLAAGGRTLAYSADTAPCAGLDRLARDADLLLCEASFLDGEDNPTGVHMTGGEAGQAAARAGAGRLLLTHLVPWGDSERSLAAATSAYAGPVELAATCRVVEV